MVSRVSDVAHWPLDIILLLLSLVEIDLVVLNKICKYFNIILLFCYYLPLEKGVALHLNKLESPSSKDVCAKF